MLLPVVYFMNNMLDKPKTGFPFVGLLTETHGKLLIFRLKETKRHYDLCHPLILIERPELSECFTVTFVEQPSVLHLD